MDNGWKVRYPLRALARNLKFRQFLWPSGTQLVTSFEVKYSFSLQDDHFDTKFGPKTYLDAKLWPKNRKVVIYLLKLTKIGNLAKNLGFRWSFSQATCFIEKMTSAFCCPSWQLSIIKFWGISESIWQP